MKRVRTAIVYWFFVYGIRFLIWILVSQKVTGRENIPRKGAFILASNHLSNVDPFLVAAALPRRMAWVTKIELFQIFFVGTMLRWCGMIPIRRFEADLAAARESLKTLKEGIVLGVFPEGTRSLDGRLQEAEPGAAHFALRAGVPVVPVSIWGSEKAKMPGAFFHRNRGINIHYGKPFTLSRRSKKIEAGEVEEGKERIMQEIASSLPEQYRGVYA